MEPRGIRNNNPGNIRYVEGITSTYAGCTGSDGSFCIFDTPENGIRALGSLLLTYQRKHKINTVEGAINRWAPPVENDTGAYVRAVAQAVGYAKDMPLDFTDPGILTGLATAIIKHENGKQPYTNEQIAAGIGAALGIRPEDAAAVPPADSAPPSTPIERPIEAPIKSPIKDTTMPAFLAFLPMLMQMIPSLIGIFGKGSAQAQVNQKAAEVVVGALTEATKSVNLQEAVEKMQKDPVVLAEARKAIDESPAVQALIEVGGGIKAAREAALAMQNSEKPFWFNPAWWVSLVLLVFPLMLCVDVFYVHPDGYDGNLKTQVVTGILAVIMMVGAFWLGTSFGSMRKTELAAEAGQRR